MEKLHCSRISPSGFSPQWVALQIQNFSLWFPTVSLKSSGTFPLYPLTVQRAGVRPATVTLVGTFFYYFQKSRGTCKPSTVIVEGYHYHHWTDKAQDLLGFFPRNPYDLSFLPSTDISTVPPHKAHGTLIVQYKDNFPHQLNARKSCHTWPSGRPWDVCTWEAKFLC